LGLLSDASLAQHYRLLKTPKKNPHKNTPKYIHLNNFLKKHTQKKPNKQKQKTNQNIFSLID
jgi:hypothetical protein